MKQLAIIALAPGQIGFYDDLSGLHLSLANREARVLSGMNTAGLVQAVQSGKITVVSGSLGSETFLYQEAVKAIPTYYRLLDKKKKQLLKKSVKPIEARELVENKEIEVQVEKVVLEETAAEAIELETEEVVVPEVEEIKEEAAPKKRSRKKKEVAETEVAEVEAKEE